MTDKAHELTDKKLEEIEKKLTAIYREAQGDIQKKSDEYFSIFEESDEEKRILVSKGKLSKEEYKQWRKDKMMYGKRYASMKEDISQRLLNVNQIATAYINSELPEVYALNYNALAEKVDGVGGYSFTLRDADTVRELALSDKSFLPSRKILAEKDIPWNKKNINSQVLQGIIQGESVPKIASRIMNVQETNRESAIRSARTIVTGAENKGRQDSYERATEDGIVLQKKWLSSDQPGRTRGWHMPESFTKLVVDQNEPFENGMGKIMFPGDPSAHPANVYNCRCSMAAVVKGFNKAQVQKAMAEKQETFDEPKTFDELSKSMNIKISKKARELDFVTTKDALDGISWAERQFPEMKGFIEKIDSNKKGGVMNTTGRTIACSPSAFSGSYYKGNHLFFQRTGVHEAAHSAEGYLISKISKSKEEYLEMWNNHTIAKSICKDALDEVLKTEYGKGKTARELYSSISGYATMSSSECMAEAVADVFEHKEKANPLSLIIFEQIKKRMKL